MKNKKHGTEFWGVTSRVERVSSGYTHLIVEFTRRRALHPQRAEEIERRHGCHSAAEEMVLKGRVLKTLGGAFVRAA